MTKFKRSLPTLSGLERGLKIEAGRRRFWDFCKLISPKFYRDNRTHLKEICDHLEALYQGRIVRLNWEQPWHIVPYGQHIPENAMRCKKFIMNIPPQHGKTRTLVNFNAWIFGQNPMEKVITGSYNDSTASDFSRFTRDSINMTRNDDDHIVYHDIFPKTRMKKGYSGFEKWALEGSHFSYMGVGIGGSVTSKGATILLIDDPVKGAAEAMNEDAMDRVWLWYSSTFSSRVASDDEALDESENDPIEIINMTRWSDKDLCGRILDGPEKSEWFVLRMKAYEEKTDTMLCPSMLSKKRYLTLKARMIDQLFNANYLQETIEATGVLFPRKQLNRFSLKAHLAQRQAMKDEAAKKDPPELIEEMILGYIDVADQGDDDFCFIVGDVSPGKVLITDVIFTQANIDVTLPFSEGLINRRNVKHTRVESNGQGTVFARWLAKKVGSRRVLRVTNTSNKHSRVLGQYGFIKQFFFFVNEDEIEPGSDYARFLELLCKYMKDGSSKRDDAPDGTSGLSKFIETWLPHMFQMTETDESKKEKEDVMS